MKFFSQKLVKFSFLAKVISQTSKNVSNILGSNPIIHFDLLDQACVVFLVNWGFSKCAIDTNSFYHRVVGSRQK